MTDKSEQRTQFGMQVLTERYIVVACEVVYKELCACAAESDNPVDMIFLDQALHSVGSKQMPIALQARLDEIDTSRYKAILLGYGLCNNGICGLTADIPIVIPRAHDCITLFMGSKEAYRDYFDANPGSYYATSGWLELNNDRDTDDMFSEEKRREFLEQYGEDEVDYLMETLFSFEKYYTNYCFINTGMGNVEANRQNVMRRAADAGWGFDEIAGSHRLFQDMVDGNWNDEDFLVIEPGSTVAPSYKDDVLKLVSVPE